MVLQKYYKNRILPERRRKMAKVIKEGNVLDKYHWVCEGDESVAENWKAVAVCVRDDKYDEAKPCGAEIEFTVKDLVVRYYKGTHFRHYYIAIVCPRCNKHVRIFSAPMVVYKAARSEENDKKATWDGFADD
jgi:hypothetical protein